MLSFLLPLVDAKNVDITLLKDLSALRLNKCEISFMKDHAYF